MRTTLPSPYPYRTALVTGASSGIGEAMAHLLAARGVALTLVARRTERLEKLAAALSADHGVETEAVTADLTDLAQLEALEERIATGPRRVELLVNNAGVGSTGAFAGRPVAEEHGTVLLNALAPMRLCRAALPAMLADGHGGILNVSSFSGEVPSPYLATYAATKAFATSLGESLAAELDRTGVHVSTLVPGLTRTDIIGPGRVDVTTLPRFAWLDPEHVAAAGLTAVATGARRCVPGAQYRTLATLAPFAPVGLRRAIARFLWRH